MKFFHTADWHLGKLVQGVYMTEDQEYILQQFLQIVEDEKPDAVIIAGDLYDRAVPPPEAVQLLDDVLEQIVLQLKIPVIAIAGNHDSPSRLDFGSKIMREKGFHIVGQVNKDIEPVILQDEHGEVHFHLVPYSDPSVVRTLYNDELVKSHNDAHKKIIENIAKTMDKQARHVYVGHAFVTPTGEEQDNTSDSERPLSIGGAEHVDAHHFSIFDYTALGHLHQAHYVLQENIRYAGSILKYSISEEHHKKGFFIVEMNESGEVAVEKRLLHARRDVRTVESMMEDILISPVNGDYVFVRLLDETLVLAPMEKVRSVFPNAMHVERKYFSSSSNEDDKEIAERSHLTDVDLFKAFYKEVRGEEPNEATETIFKSVLDDMLKIENETDSNIVRENRI